MSALILAINPGSTSTKIAVYDGAQQLWSESIEHSLSELKQYDSIHAQLPMRHALVVSTAEEKGLDFSKLAAVVSRGGPFARVRSGAYEITPAMLDVAQNRPMDNHPSLLGMFIAYEIAQKSGSKPYIYDAVTVDEMLPVSRITGLKNIERLAKGHTLNMRAAALRLCRAASWKYDEKNIIVCHLGGGITTSLHSRGRIIDMLSDDAIHFAPERAGGLPAYQLVEMCYTSDLDFKDMMRQLQRSGGLISLLGTPDAREVEKMIANGDAWAKLVYEAMALNVAKGIATLAVVPKTKIDAVILTGGIAHSSMLTRWIAEHVAFIAPITVMPGENEMEALAQGAHRILLGQETARIFTPDEFFE